MYNRSMATLTVSQARAALPELLTRVEQGEEVTITRHGRAVAVLVRPDVLWTRSNVAIETADRVHDLLAAAAASDLPLGVGLTAEKAEELLAEIRSGRDSR
jgi:antitoxin (DNA-binding transcriptional repressor) of toxin-antitoxin stability system